MNMFINKFNFRALDNPEDLEEPPEDFVFPNAENATPASRNTDIVVVDLTQITISSDESEVDD